MRRGAAWPGFREGFPRVRRSGKAFAASRKDLHHGKKRLHFTDKHVAQSLFYAEIADKHVAHSLFYAEIADKRVAHSLFDSEITDKHVAHSLFDAEIADKYVAHSLYDLDVIEFRAGGFE